MRILSCPPIASALLLLTLTATATPQDRSRTDAEVPSVEGRVIPLDLTSTGTMMPVEPGEIVIIRLINAIPGKGYTENITRVPKPIATLPEFAGIASQGLGERQRGDPQRAACKEEVICEAERLAKGILEAEREEEVRTNLVTLGALTAKLPPCVAALSDIQRWMAMQTTRVVVPLPIRAGEDYTITIVRDDTDPTRRRSWTVQLQTPSRGEWLTTFGMGFAPGRDDRHFARAGEDPQQFVITRENDGETVTPIPAVFFTWLSAANRNRDWVHGPTAGLGIATNTPAFLVGWQLTYNSNIGLVAGLGAYQRWKLLGKYSAGDIVGENLTEQQLMQRTYTGALFVAATYRFGRNPFGEERKQPEKKEAEKAEGPEK